MDTLQSGFQTTVPSDQKMYRSNYFFNFSDNSSQMRLLPVLILLVISCQAIAQDFTGPWILVDARRIDGSKIVERNRYITHFEYSFTKERTISVDSIGYSLFSQRNTLIFDDSRHAHDSWKSLELLSDTVLVITEKHTDEDLDKKNRFVYLRKDAYLRFLRMNNLLEFDGPTTIRVNKFIFPTLDFLSNRSFESFMSERIRPAEGAVTGTFIVSKDGMITYVAQVESRGFTQWERLVVAIKETSRQWQLPLPGYSYKVPFTVMVNASGDAEMTFRANDFAWLASDRLGTSGAEARLQTAIYERGIKLAEQGRHEKAAEVFTQYIEKNPYNVDAYYNRAVAYYQMNDLAKACQDWKYLKDLEQVAATNLHNQHCRE